MSKRSPLPVKKRPTPRRRSRPPRRRAPLRNSASSRRFRLSAFVARKVEEHAHLARDASRIAVSIALGAILFFLIGAISRSLPPNQESRIAPAAAPR